MKLNVRTATALDVKAMHRLRHRVRENRLSRATGISAASYLPYIAAGSAWVAEGDLGITGFAAIDVAARTVWALFVDPDAEGAGVGRALHNRMVEWAMERGIERLSLSTKQGSRAVQFYTRAGWKEIGTTADGEVLFEKSLRT